MRKSLFILVAFLVIIAGSFNSVSAAVVVPVHPPNTLDSAAVKAAFESFRALPKKTQRSKLKQVKKAIKDFRAERKAGRDPDTNTLLLVLLAILVPPLAVYLHQGETNNKFWITLILFIAGLAGVFFLSHFLIFVAIVYALLVILAGV
jgi:uncharacterized membrane protein YqaE (UPF0057 family)